MVSLDGILTYRARPDGSPYSVVDQARGTYTELPDGGDKVDCGDVLYRVDDHPVLLLCGAVPAYRDLHVGDAGGTSAAQPEPARARLRRHAGVAPDDDRSRRDREALEELQPARGSERDRELDVEMRSSCPGRCGSPR